MMSSYWVNFVNNGDPNGQDLPEWKAFDNNNRSVMRLSKEMEMIPVTADEERYDFIYEQIMKSVR